MVPETAQPAVSVPEQTTAQPRRLWNKDFLLLWQGQFVSRLGNQAFNIALVLWIVQNTGSATLMGLLLMVSSIPALILAPIGGAFADRYPRKKIIIACDLISGIVVLALTALLFLRPDATEVILVGIFITAICLAVSGSFFGPAIGASVPDLVPKERIAVANSLGQFSIQLSLFIGQGFGATLFRILGAPLMFLFNGLSFLFSAFSELFIRIPQSIPERSSRWQDRFGEFRRDLAEGLRYVWGTTGLKGLVLISAVGNFFTAPILLLLPFYVTEYLGVREDWYGFLLAAFGVGALLGFLVIGLMPPSGRVRLRAMLLVMFVDASTYGLLVLAPGPWPALALAVLSGATGGFLTVNITTLVQLTTPSEIRGRIFGLLATISGSITPIAMGLSGVVADLTGRNVPLIYLTCSAILLLLAVIITGHRDIRTFLAYDPPRAAKDSPAPALSSNG